MTGRPKRREEGILALSKSVLRSVALILIVAAMLMATLLGNEVHAQTTAGKLSQLTVRSEGTSEGYDRDSYPHWSNAEEFGWNIPAGTPDPESCDARAAALIRDGEGVRVGSGCAVSRGRWLDPYTGETLRQSSDVDADHIVPLAESYRSGSARWSEARKERFANSPGEVLIVDDAANASKSDSDPAGYKPPRRAYWCKYATKWVNVKSTWKLSVDSAEKKALQSMLATCSVDSGSSPPRGGQSGEQQPETEQTLQNPQPVGGQTPRSDASAGGGSQAKAKKLPNTGGPFLLPLVALLVGSGAALTLATRSIRQ